MHSIGLNLFGNGTHIFIHLFLFHLYLFLNLFGFIFHPLFISLPFPYISKSFLTFSFKKLLLFISGILKKKFFSLFLSFFKHFLSLLSLFDDRIALDIDTFHGLSFLFQFSGFLISDLLFKQIMDDFLLMGAVDGWGVEYGLVGFFLRFHLSLELSLPLFDHDLSLDVGQPLLLQKFLSVQFCCFLFLLLFQQFFLLPPVLQFPHRLLLFFINAESAQ